MNLSAGTKFFCNGSWPDRRRLGSRPPCPARRGELRGRLDTAPAPSARRNGRDLHVACGRRGRKPRPLGDGEDPLVLRCRNRPSFPTFCSYTIGRPLNGSEFALTWPSVLGSVLGTNSGRVPPVVRHQGFPSPERFRVREPASRGRMRNLRQRSPLALAGQSVSDWLAGSNAPVPASSKRDEQPMSRSRPDRRRGEGVKHVQVIEGFQ